MAEWWTCEDCMGTGRGPGYVECGACGGDGQFPADAEADNIVRAREDDRREAAYARAARAYDEAGPVDAYDF